MSCGTCGFLHMPDIFFSLFDTNACIVLADICRTAKVNVTGIAWHAKICSTTKFGGLAMVWRAGICSGNGPSRSKPHVVSGRLEVELTQARAVNVPMLCMSGQGTGLTLRNAYRSVLCFGIHLATHTDPERTL